MNFFEHQELARKRTRRLVLLYILCVLAIILGVYAVVLTTLCLGSENARNSLERMSMWEPRLFAACTGIAIVLVLTGSLYKIWQLGSGGAAVANLLGGRQIPPNTQDLNERKVLNVVEEMAIASGVGVPPVYLMENENGINAFAAGYSPGDAVIGVSKGCISVLSRDELQGVIAHEFSHIFNGDMRLNIRLIALLNGILVIGLTGEWILRIFKDSRRSYSSNKKNGGGGIALFGFLLMALGYIGVFFARIIKSAVSRQREFLADASAVQFTRNPGGISGALKKIGGLHSGSAIRSPSAEEASHMFFADGLSRLTSVFATHPPLEERIRRIEPRFDGTFPEVAAPQPEEQDARISAMQRRPAAPPPPLEFTPQEVVEQVGNASDEHLVYAQQLLASIPAELVERIREPTGAISLVFALLAADNSQGREQKWDYLQREASEFIAKEARAALPQIEALGREYWLPLLDLTRPTLRNLSKPQYETFRKHIQEIAGLDSQLSLFEYAILQIVTRRLDNRFSGKKPGQWRYETMPEVLNGSIVILSALARVSSGRETQAAEAYCAGAHFLDPYGRKEPLPKEELSLKEIGAALQRLSEATPILKGQVMKAFAACVAKDGKLMQEEHELLRAVAEALDIPLPPLVRSLKTT